MIFNRLIFSILIIVFSAVAEAKPPELTPHSTHKKAEEIFKSHVTHKELNPEISSRTLKNYLDELDPTKTYLLASEVACWDEPKGELLEALISNYKKENFEPYEAMYQVMIQAIKRRNELEKKVAKLPTPNNAKASDFKDITWAKNESELESRLLTLRALQLETADQLEIDSKEQFMQRLDKRRASREDEVLQGGKKKLQKQQALSYFLKSFSSALDSHTVYFTPQEANQFMVQVQQRLFGIGAQLRDDLTGFTLVRLLEGGPALRDGHLKAGDKIIAVNHEPVAGMDIIEAVDLIRGPKGTAVGLTVVRESNEGEEKKTEKFDIEVVRDEIVLKETRFEVEKVPYGNGMIALLRLFSFYQDPNDSSASDLKNALNEIKKNENLLGVILDLRGNAGGLLPQAVAVTGLFIKKGVVVSVKDSEGNIQHLRNFDGALTWDGPLMVLTNKGSASAAEIVAQTLKDYGRALLIGDPYTWGKGSYQLFTLEAGNVNKINPQGEYKVTRGLYYTVSGKSPQLTGTKVDIEVPGGLTELEIGESFAKFPLENDEIAPNYVDNLADIHPFHRGKMMRMYKKDQQKKVDLYGPYLEVLRKNSAHRIKQNRNYQNFLKEVKKEEFDIESMEKYGQNDLQLEESLNVMKDLILMERLANELLPAAAGG
ncbi:MAG: PDZ domain-containing protein [Simkaniaceae bacterium]|nr:MAG: PDZ domain-containing protein [Simkaniaceae bacterium]